MRKGMGIGKGSGYRNLIIKDRSIHSQSAKGIKQPQMFALPVRIIDTPVNRANRLPLQVGLIVPSKNKDGSRISPVEFAKRIEQEQKWFDSNFGGDTSFKAEGGYVDSKKRIMEDTVFVTSSTSVARFEELKKKLMKHVKQRRKAWDQDTVFLRIEGQDYIYPRKGYITDDKNQGKQIIVQ